MQAVEPRAEAQNDQPQSPAAVPCIVACHGKARGLEGGDDHQDAIKPETHRHRRPAHRAAQPDIGQTANAGDECGDDQCPPRDPVDARPAPPDWPSQLDHRECGDQRPRQHVQRDGGGAGPRACEPVERRDVTLQPPHPARGGMPDKALSGDKEQTKAGDGKGCRPTRHFSGISPRGLNRSTSSNTSPIVKSRICAADSSRWSRSQDPSAMPAVISCIRLRPIGSTITQSHQIRNPPRTAPRLLPDPPTITITQTRKVKRSGWYEPGVSCPSSVVIIAPAIPQMAEPSTKTCRCRAVTSLPIASAATSLSRIARIIRPQGECSARWTRMKRPTSTTANSPA
mmetsp:Transcript_23572/g.41691  ORF Transcript_23572/g.41691 Transcript_23572/m.41691 type:complete len:341 (+) Transcript_23572:2492-3514(+)